MDSSMQFEWLRDLIINIDRNNHILEQQSNHVNEGVKHP